MQERAQELSVDRVGLIACGSVDIAIRALMKTVSGLSSEHLRFDVGTFISQLDKSVKPVDHHALPRFSSLNLSSVQGVALVLTK